VFCDAEKAPVAKHGHTSDLEDELAALDEELYSFLDKLRDASAGPRSEAVTRIYSFMTKFGGLGLLSHVETRGHAYLASIAVSREVLKRIGLNNHNTVRDLGNLQENAGVPENRNFYKLVEQAMPTVEEEHQRVSSQKARTMEDMQRKYDKFLDEMPANDRVTLWISRAKSEWDGYMQSQPTASIGNLVTAKLLLRSLSTLSHHRYQKGHERIAERWTT
jgi:hypothetical protein